MDFFMISVVSAPFRAFFDSDGVGQIIVVVQILMSVSSWGVIINRLMGLREQKERSSRFVGDFLKAADPLEFYYNKYPFTDTPMERVYLGTCERLANLIPAQQRLLLASDPSTPILLNAGRMALVETTCARETDDAIVKMNAGTTVLAIITNAAPLLGLFGTVWGVMLAFQSMAASGSANIAELAPGISSALLTTVVGLVVAIPSTIFYNALQAKIERATVDLEGFSEELMGRLSLRYLGSREG